MAKYVYMIMSGLIFSYMTLYGQISPFFLSEYIWQFLHEHIWPYMKKKIPGNTMGVIKILESVVALQFYTRIVDNDTVLSERLNVTLLIYREYKC